jgi:hypothetical protein
MPLSRHGNAALSQGIPLAKWLGVALKAFLADL